MPPVVNKTLRSRWFVVGVHASLWFLLYLVVTTLRGKVPDVREAGAVGNTPQSPAPVASLQRLFSPGIWPKSLNDTNLANPFFTRYFVPPPPPPPTTRKIDVTYQGFYQNGNGPKTAIFKLDDAFMVAPIGSTIAIGLSISDVTVQAMTLTNLTAQTNIVLLNAKKEIIVPLK